jgi:hypothetical protein
LPSHILAAQAGSPSYSSSSSSIESPSSSSSSNVCDEKYKRVFNLRYNDMIIKYRAIQDETIVSIKAVNSNQQFAKFKKDIDDEIEKFNNRANVALDDLIDLLETDLGLPRKDLKSALYKNKNWADFEYPIYPCLENIFDIRDKHDKLIDDVTKEKDKKIREF